MNFINNIENVLQWHEQIIDIRNKQEFMQYLYGCVINYFQDIDKKKYTNFNIKYEPHEICISIFYNKFVARLEGDEVKFYKERLAKGLILLGSYSFYTIKNSHQLFEKNLEQFHPDYIIVMIEDAFLPLNIISERINQKQYWLTR